MRELALFAGAGGGLYGTLLLGWRTVCAIEVDPYRRAVLVARIADGTFEPFEIHDDVRSFDAERWRGRVDVVTGGFPCQPFSLAGKRAGADDERNLWPETIRVIREVRPRFAYLENVPGLLASRYFGRVLGDLAECGYDAEWCVLGADDVGAPHRRKRLWILAYDSERGCEPRWAGRPDSGRARESEQPLHVLSEPLEGELRLQPGWRNGTSWSSQAEPGDDGTEESVADADAERLEGERSGGLLNGKRAALRDDADGCDSQDVGNTTQFGWDEGANHKCPGRGSQIPTQGSGWWDRDPADEGHGSESFVGRVAHGVANRRHRLAALGDGQVPAVVRAAWTLLYGRLAGGGRSI